jgi:hypothetical protein
VRVVANDPIQERVEWHGVPIDVEWPKGSVREYTDDDTGAVTFRKNMYCDYGYIRGTDTRDGEEIDVYLGNNPESAKVFVVDQLVVPDSYEEAQGAEPGEHDEWKYMIGFDTPEEAQHAYELHMTGGHYGGIAEFTVPEFLDLVEVASDGEV